MSDILSAIDDKEILKKIYDRIRATKINVLLIGGTGAGKSSTISALFQDYGGGRKADVKIGSNFSPETKDVSKHELDNLVVWDTPGFGDSTEEDSKHKDKIVNLLLEKDQDGKPLIDLILLVLNAGSRDFGSAYALINNVVLPSVHKDDQNRLLIGINQADMALQRRHWNFGENRPEPKLIERLDEQAQTVKERFKNEAGLDVDPIYYSAGYSDGGEVLRPYNLQKLLSLILVRLPEKKRASVKDHINQDRENFRYNDGKEDYERQVEESVRSSFFLHVKDVLAEGFGQAKKFITDPDVVKAIGAALGAAFVAAIKSKK